MSLHLLNLLKKRLKSQSRRARTLTLVLRSFRVKLMFPFQSRKKTPKLVCGFTLIELIVSVGIMIMVTSVILANYTTFNKRIKLEGVSQEIASIIREAQAYGISSNIGSGLSSIAYGVHFDKASNNTVIIFADNITENGIYDPGEEVEEFVIQSSDTIERICVDQKLVVPSPCPGGVNDINVVYKRTNIYADIGNTSLSGIYDAEILFRSAGETANGVKVIIWKSGQVSVEAE